MPRGLKAPYYNFFFDHDDGTHLIFNALSGAFATVSDSQYESAKRLLKDPESFEAESEEEEQLLEGAQRSNFVLESDTDQCSTRNIHDYFPWAAADSDIA